MDPCWLILCSLPQERCVHLHTNVFRLLLKSILFSQKCFTLQSLDFQWWNGIHFCQLSTWVNVYLGTIYKANSSNDKCKKIYVILQYSYSTMWQTVWEKYNRTLHHNTFSSPMQHNTWDVHCCKCSISTVKLQIKYSTMPVKYRVDTWKQVIKPKTDRRTNTAAFFLSSCMNNYLVSCFIRKTKPSNILICNFLLHTQP